MVGETHPGGRVLCFDAKESERRGKAMKLWEYRVGGRVFDIAISDDKVFATSDEGIYCLALREPGGDGTTQLLWKIASSSNNGRAPLVDGGHCYIGLGTDRSAIACVDAATGMEIWRVAAPLPVCSSMAMRDGKLYLGIGHGKIPYDWREARNDARRRLLNSGASSEELEKKLAAIGPEGEIWCIDIASQKVEWRFKTAEAVVGAIAIDGDRLYFGSRGGQLYCLTTDGKVVGQRQFLHPVVCPAAVGPEYVYVQIAGEL